MELGVSYKDFICLNCKNRKLEGSCVYYLFLLNILTELN